MYWNRKTVAAAVVILLLIYFSNYYFRFSLFIVAVHHSIEHIHEIPTVCMYTFLWCSHSAWTDDDVRLKVIVLCAQRLVSNLPISAYQVTTTTTKKRQGNERFAVSNKVTQHKKKDENENSGNIACQRQTKK